MHRLRALSRLPNGLAPRLPPTAGIAVRETGGDHHLGNVHIIDEHVPQLAPVFIARGGASRKLAGQLGLIDPQSRLIAIALDLRSSINPADPISYDPLWARAIASRICQRALSHASSRHGCSILPL